MKKNSKLVALVFCFALLAQGLAGCGADGSLTAPPSTPASSPAATTAVPTPSLSPTATPVPTPAPTATPSPDGIIPGEGFAVPEGDGLPIGEFVLGHGGFIYYCDADGLWRVDGKLKGKTRIVKMDGAIRQFFFDADGTLYFTAEAADGTHELTFYRYRDGKPALLVKGFSKIFRVDGGYAYLLVSSGVSLEARACELASGSTRAWLGLGPAVNFRFQGGLLYFIDTHGQLFARDMRTGRSERVFQNLSALAYDKGDWALNLMKRDGHVSFEAYRYSDRSLRTIKLDDSIPLAFPTDALFRVLSFDGKYLYLCYNGYEEAATFYQVDAATGKAVKRLKADQCAALCVNGILCYIFTGTYSDGGAPRNLNVWACNMAGGTKTLLKRLPAKTGMVEQLQVAGGYVWGFGSAEKRLGADTLYCTRYLFTLPVK